MALPVADTVVRQTLWNAEVARSGHDDKIVVRNIQVTVNAGTDVWARRKTQPALITVTLTLRRQFTSAASTDAVDNSTVHYGTLTKAIRERIQDEAMAWMSTPALAAVILLCVRHAAGSTELFAVETDIFYLKGSMFGEGAGYITSSVAEAGLWSYVLYLRNVRIPCIIGVNPNERQQKQVVIVNIWIDGVPKGRDDEYSALETFLFACISESSFQTIESLLAWVIEELKQKFFIREEDHDAWIRLKIEKPLAVPFADAPAIEITRSVRSTQLHSN